jgi:hypothetical protein
MKLPASEIYAIVDASLANDPGDPLTTWLVRENMSAKGVTPAYAAFLDFMSGEHKCQLVFDSPRDTLHLVIPARLFIHNAQLFSDAGFEWRSDELVDAFAASTRRAEFFADLGKVKGYVEGFNSSKS